MTHCGRVTAASAASQFVVDCGGAVGRYLFLYQLTAAKYLAVCEVTAFGYQLGNVTNDTTPAPTHTPSVQPLAPISEPTPPTPQPTTRRPPLAPAQRNDAHVAVRYTAFAINGRARNFQGYYQVAWSP